MFDWKKLLSDKATYPDDLTVEINGEKVTIGALRTHNAASQGETANALQARETAIAERETKTSRAAERLATIVETIATTTGLTFDQIIAGDTAAAKAAADKVREQAGREGIRTTDGAIDWTKDPIYAPVDARFKPMEAGFNNMQAALRAGLGVVQNDRTELAYLRFRVENPELAKGLKYEDAVKLAVDKNYKDDVGFPDVRKALGELAAPKELEANKTKWESDAEKRGYDKARAEMMGGVGQPAGQGAAGMEFVPTPDKPAGKVSSIADQLTKALNDPDILRSGMVQ